jgi:hypothetical protein
MNAGQLPRGVRNNNFGNIEDGSFAQSLPGYKGSDGRFAVFETPEHGMTAMDRLLTSYGKRGINTVSGVIDRWAPSADGNNTGNYSRYVAEKAGFAPTAVIDMNDPAVRQKLAGAMAEFENDPSATPMRSAFAAERPQRAPETPPALSSQVVAGGPGILSETAKPNYDLGSSLQSAGAYLMAISDPRALNALGSIKPKEDGFTTTYDPATGTIFKLNSRTGKVETQRNPNWQGEKIEPTVLKSLSEDWSQKYGTLHATAERAKYFKDAIDSGKLNLSAYNQWLEAPVKSALGLSDEGTRLMNEFKSFKTKMANDSLRLNAGVQTEGDAQRAMNEFATGPAQFDPKTVSTQLHNFIDNTRKVMHESARSQLDAASSRYKSPAVFEPYYKRLQEQQRFYEDYTKSLEQPKGVPTGLPKGVRSITEIKAPIGVQ